MKLSKIFLLAAEKMQEQRMYGACRAIGEASYGFIILPPLYYYEAINYFNELFRSDGYVIRGYYFGTPFPYSPDYEEARKDRVLALLFAHEIAKSEGL